MSLRALLAAAVMLAFVSGGFLHAVIPHDDGATDDHGALSAHTLIWVSLHSALQHEDKKFVALPLLLFFETVFCLIVGVVAAVAFEHDPLGSMLRRGIAKYRRFG